MVEGYSRVESVLHLRPFSLYRAWVIYAWAFAWVGVLRELRGGEHHKSASLSFSLLSGTLKAMVGWKFYSKIIILTQPQHRGRVQRCKSLVENCHFPLLLFALVRFVKVTYHTIPLAFVSCRCVAQIAMDFPGFSHSISRRTVCSNGSTTRKHPYLIFLLVPQSPNQTHWAGGGLFAEAFPLNSRGTLVRRLKWVCFFFLLLLFASPLTSCSSKLHDP